MEGDTVFHANTCFVCHLTSKETKLKHCSSCKMISYCSESHQKKHWKKHKKLCGVIQKVDKMLSPENLEDKLNWYKYRTNFMMLCELEMGRKLSPCEMNMILFPNSCQVCHCKSVSETCENCLCVSYCSPQHKNADYTFHSGICNSLALCIKVDLYLQRNHFYPSYSLCGGRVDLPDTMEKYLISNIKIIDSIQDSKVVEEALVSELITCPLSLLNALNWINFHFKEKIIIHVVGSELLETASLKSWEIILHLHAQIKNCQIFFIGPETNETKEEYCNSCKNILKFHFIQDFYHNFINMELYQKPDVICCFNCGFHEYEGSDSDTWMETLPVLVENASPLIITSFTEDEADKDLGKLKNINKNLFIKKSDNSYSSLRPYRDLENLGIYYNNKILSLILNNAKV